ncbi:MAG: hypothetical protein LUH07_04180 [Lachnospiraceae bacterium]|nr:hypothetical protein [Lachnospiraceae bacterium]
MALFEKNYLEGEYNDNVEELLDATKDLAALDWEDAYWLAKCIQSADTDIDTDEVVIKLINYEFNHGLNYSVNKEKYFYSAKMLSRLYLRRRDYECAINYLMDIDERSEDAPDWVNVYYLLSQIMTDNIYRIAQDPTFFYERLNSIGEESYKSRAEIYKVFIDRLRELEKAGTKRQLNIPSFEEKIPEYIGEYILVNQEYTEYDVTDQQEKEAEVKPVEKVCYEKLSEEEDERLQNLQKALEEKETEIKRQRAQIAEQKEQIEEQVDRLREQSAQIEERDVKIKEREAALVNARLFTHNYQSNDMDEYPLLRRNEKILVLGALAAKKVELLSIAKKEYNLKDENLEFMDDYDKMTNFKIRENHRAIICGPMPHKMDDTDGYRSLISRLEGEEGRYVIRCEAGANGLKITKTSFRMAIQKVMDYLSVTA